MLILSSRNIEKEKIDPDDIWELVFWLIKNHQADKWLGGGEVGKRTVMAPYCNGPLFFGIQKKNRDFGVPLKTWFSHFEVGSIDLPVLPILLLTLIFYFIISENRLVNNMNKW